MGTQWIGRLLIGLALSFQLPRICAETGTGVPGYALPPPDWKNSSASASPGVQSANLPKSLTVLLLGDSLSLCGFGKSLDRRLRSTGCVKSTFTYMACGTIPVSWLKAKPFTNAKTYCGFWSIESVEGSSTPKEFEDTYGMKRGYRPQPHLVPKLEDLLSALHPDILVMQTGNNLLSLFRDGRTVLPTRDGPILRSLIKPFLSEALRYPSTLKKIYWVASPISGRVTKQVQDFVVEQVRLVAADKATVIDSRQLVSYPYRHVAPDREHFFGAQMDEWADNVFKIISQDLESHPLNSAPPLTSSSPETDMSANQSQQRGEGELTVLGTLVFKSQPLPINNLLPYRESLVAYIYDVQEVLKGSYSDKQILVMHPAHIDLQTQSLDKYEIGNKYELHLRELAGTEWSTVKSRDDSNRIDLIPYIQVEDIGRFPAQDH